MGEKLLIPGGNDHTNTTTTSSTCGNRNRSTTPMSSTNRSSINTSNNMIRAAPATAARAADQERPSAQENQVAVKCPRCDSSNTKFCYYNNYSLSQPRHFCKACKRYWTRGGTLRNMPVGGGCRKNKRIKKPAGASASVATRGAGDQRPQSLLPNSANPAALLSIPISCSSHTDASLFYALGSAASASSGMGISLPALGNSGVQIPDAFTSTAFDLSALGLGFSSNMQSGNDNEYALGLQMQHLSPNAVAMPLMTAENSLLRSSLPPSASASLLVSSLKQPKQKTEDYYHGLPQYEELQANPVLFKGVKQEGKQADVLHGSRNCSEQWQVPLEMAYYNLGSFGSNVDAGINATSDSSFLYWDVANYGPPSSSSSLAS